jgi:hypothetical protein
MSHLPVIKNGLAARLIFPAELELMSLEKLQQTTLKTAERFRGYGSTPLTLAPALCDFCQQQGHIADDCVARAYELHRNHKKRRRTRKRR